MAENSNPKCSCCKTNLAASNTNPMRCVQCNKLHTEPKPHTSAKNCKQCDCCQQAFGSNIPSAEYQCGDPCKYYLCDPCHSQHSTCPEHPWSTEKPGTSLLQTSKRTAAADDPIILTPNQQTPRSAGWCFN